MDLPDVSADLDLDTEGRLAMSWFQLLACVAGMLVAYGLGYYNGGVRR